MCTPKRLSLTLFLWVVASLYFQVLGQIRTFSEQAGAVNFVCFSPDGKMVLSGSENLKLWDVKTGQVIRTLNSLGALSGCFSPDGKTALLGNTDNTLQLWDIQTGQVIRTFTGHMAGVKSVCFSPDGKTALSGSGDKTLKLWDIQTGQMIRTFSGHTSYLMSVRFSPDGKMALSGSWDHTLRLWDIQSGQVIRAFSGHTHSVVSVCFSPDGKTALSGSADNALKLWDIQTGQVIRTFLGHADHIVSVCFSPDGRTALSGSKDHTLKCWDIEAGQMIHSFSGYTGYINSISFSPDGKMALSVGADGILKLWDISPEAIALAKQEEAQRQEAARIAEAQREAQRQEAVRIAAQKRVAQIQTNSNKALWKLGNKICTEKDGGIYQAVIDQWNEDKSSVKVVVVSGPSNTFEGQKAEKGSSIWISPNGWHLCLDDEIQSSLSNDNSAPTPAYTAPKEEYKYKVGDVVSCYKWSGNSGWKGTVLDKRDGKYYVQLIDVDINGWGIQLNASSCSGNVPISYDNYKYTKIWVDKYCVE